MTSTTDHFELDGDDQILPRTSKVRPKSADKVVRDSSSRPDSAHPKSVRSWRETEQLAAQVGALRPALFDQALSDFSSGGFRSTSSPQITISASGSRGSGAQPKLDSYSVNIADLARRRRDRLDRIAAYLAEILTIEAAVIDTARTLDIEDDE